jgi:hypothetical protein
LAEEEVEGGVACGAVMRTLSGEAVVVLFFVGSLQLVSAIFG